MPRPERDRLRETRTAHDEIPFAWKLGACAALLFLVGLIAAALLVPFSCLLNDWPEPVCRMLQAVIPQAEKGE